MMESYSYQLFKVVVSLFVVLGLMGGVMVLLRFLMQKRERLGSGRLPIRVLGRGFIGYKKDIVVVDVAGETLILGVTADNIVCLGKLEDKGLTESLRQDEQNKSPIIEKILNSLSDSTIRRRKTAELKDG